MTGKRVALVTGAGSGIGCATAGRLSAEGFHIVLTGRSVEALEETAGQCGGDVTVLPCDLVMEDAIVSLVRAVGDHSGRLDVLVNCAAQSIPGRLEQVQGSSAQQLWQVNVLGPTMLTQGFPVLEGIDPVRMAIFGSPGLHSFADLVEDSPTP